MENAAQWKNEVDWNVFILALLSVQFMFNPKERLQQLRKNKTAKEEATSFLTDNTSPPLFQEPIAKPPQDLDLAARLARLQNTVNELSGQLRTSNEAVHVLRKEKSELETKLLRLEYENSQLKVSSRTANEERSERMELNVSSRPLLRQSMEGRRTHSQLVPEEPLLPQVEEALEQVKKEPIENILKKMEHNFRALKADPRQISTGNKHLKDFAAICKDYNKTLKKPVLVIRLNSGDFD